MKRRLISFSWCSFLVLFVLLAFFLTSCDGNFFWNKDFDTFVRGNYEFITGNDIDISSDTVVISGKEFRISILSKKGSCNIRIFVPHDSEDAAFDTGLRAIASGGLLVALENKEERNLYDLRGRKATNQDPNRMFCEENHYWPLAKRILEILLENKEQGQRFLLALHNNRPDGNFNLVNLKKRKDISVLSCADPDKKSVIWISSSDEKPSAEMMKEIEFYKRSEFNVIYEHVLKKNEKLGSLSILAALMRIPYINIETLRGERENRESEQKALERQMKYLKKVREFHKF